MDLSIDRYKVKRLVGQGAMGKVYLATDPKLGRDVAIKVLNSDAANATVRERFRLEARSIAALKHPNIVELYDYSGEEAEDLFLVLEYIPGRTLHDHIVERGPMSEVTALCVAHELLLALEHAHSGQVVHRDLKPENVLLHAGRVVLTDFGIVKQVAASGERGREREQTQVLGTPGFMAPEQFVGRDVSERTDLFGLGAVLYNLVTARLPFLADSIDDFVKKVRSGKYDDPRSFSPLLSDGFCDVVSWCLRPKAIERPESAGLVRHRVLEILRAHGVTEVRSEIIKYERSPATYAVEQRERGLDVLVRDLKLAVKDRDEPKAQAIVKRMQTIAPITDLLRDVSGIEWDPKRGARLVEERKPSRALRWLVLGFVLGSAVGGASMLVVSALNLVPAEMVEAATKIGNAVVGKKVGPIEPDEVSGAKKSPPAGKSKGRRGK